MPEARDGTPDCLRQLVADLAGGSRPSKGISAINTQPAGADSGLIGHSQDDSEASRLSLQQLVPGWRAASPSSVADRPEAPARPRPEVFPQSSAQACSFDQAPSADFSSLDLGGQGNDRSAQVLQIRSQSGDLDSPGWCGLAPRQDQPGAEKPRRHFFIADRPAGKCSSHLL